MTALFSKIAIVGAGALGCYFGARLAQAGTAVTLVGRPMQVEAIRRDGLILEADGKTQVLRPEITTDAGAVRDVELVLVCVKSADTAAAAAAVAPHLDADAALVSLQNGMGNVETIRERTGRPVVAGLVYIGANMPAPNHVRHAGGNRVVLGAITGSGADRALVEQVAALFRSAGVAAEMSADMDAELWRKLLFNCAYNAVCALTGKPYGEMGAMPDVRAVMQSAADEVAALARRKGVTIPDEALASLFAMTQSMPLQMSSTAQDLARGRPTEIDYLNGYIARESAALGLAAPANRTLNALVKLRERT
jgi:2-dehydropantoate 2-reductase